MPSGAKPVLLVGGPSTRPAAMSLPLHGCLRDTPAGAASSVAELF